MLLWKDPARRRGDAGPGRPYHRRCDTTDRVLEMAMEHAWPYFARWLGESWETAPPMELTGSEVVQLLWPLNDVFRPRIQNMNDVPYDPNLGIAADFAIDAAVETLDLAVLADADLRAIRVLLERTAQTMTAATAFREEMFMELPAGLSGELRLFAAILILLRSMELPWPPGGPLSSAAG